MRFGKPNIELALSVGHQKQRERPDELYDCDFVWLFALAALTLIALKLIDWDDLLVVPNPCNVVPTASGNQVKVHCKVAAYYVLQVGVGHTALQIFLVVELWDVTALVFDILNPLQSATSLLRLGS